MSGTRGKIPPLIPSREILSPTCHRT